MKTELLKRWILGLCVVAVLVIIFTSLAEDVWFKESFSWDNTIILWLHHFSAPWLDFSMIMLTQTGEIGAFLVAILVAIWFYRRGDRLDAWAILICLAGAFVLNNLLKVFFTRARPDLFTPLVLAHGFSFPSGHVTTSVAVYGFLAVLLWRQGRRLWPALLVLLILIVAISRVYLGAHYPSDTFAAMAFTSLWLIIVFVVRDKYRSRMNKLSTYVK